MARVPVVEKEDHRKGIYASAILFFLVLFLLFFIKYHEPDPPKVTPSLPITMADEGIDEFEVDNAGGGAPAETENQEEAVSTPAEEQPTQEESPVTTPTGDGASEESSSEAEEAANPFSGAGSGGQGSAGSGGGFGADDGPGTGTGDPGTGGTGDRVRLKNIQSKPKTPNSNLCQIALKLTIDSRGTVVAASIVRANTTTTNQKLIDEVIELVKKEVRYEEKPDSRNENAFYTITVKPS